jgi:hypothetical protein
MTANNETAPKLFAWANSHRRMRFVLGVVQYFDFTWEDIDEEEIGNQKFYQGRLADHDCEQRDRPERLQ